MPVQTPFRAELVEIAHAEWERLGATKRGAAALRERIEKYCRDLGVEMTAPVDRFHYSAAFISWCMRQAGASEEEFPTTVGHWTYAKRAIHAADSGNGLFLGRPIASYAPRPGDLVHMNRNGGTVTYEQARNTTGYRAESGIVVETDHATGTAVLVVGNQEPDGNIGRENVRVSENGLIVQRPHDPFICAIEVLK